MGIQLSLQAKGRILILCVTKCFSSLVPRFFLSHFQEAVVSCWVQFSDGTVVPLELFDRTTYSLTVSTPDEGVATVRRTPLSTFLVAQGEGRGQGALVRVEMRICEECQKSKRKSKLAVGTGLVRVNFRSSGRVVAGERGGNKVGADGGKDFDGGASELVGGPRTTQRALVDVDKWSLRPAGTALTKKPLRPDAVGFGTTTRPTRRNPSTDLPMTAAPPRLNTPLSAATPKVTTVGSINKREGQKRGYRNMLDSPDSPSNKDVPEAEATPKKEPPKSKPPKVENDLVATFRAMSDVEIGTYAVVGVTCVAILAVLLKCASNKLCFRGKKTPIQAGPSPAGDPKDHKHDWVWLESNSEGTSAPGAPAQVSTLKREAHRPAESHHSVDSAGRGGMECTLPTVSAPAAPERTATLGRSRNSSQQQHFQGAAMSPMASRSATLLARPQHSEPLHSPTSKRNQVQFTTFTTLDIKHLAALKKNGVDLNWAHQQTLQHQTPAKPQSPLPDMPWPVVKPLAEPQ